MNINSQSFQVPENRNELLQINILNKLTATETQSIRDEIQLCQTSEYPVVYLNAKYATEIDLSGINEVIHSHFVLQQNSKNLILVYKKDSNIEKWVKTTGLEKFMDTAVVL